MPLFTIGYEKRSLDEYVDLLLEHGVRSSSTSAKRHGRTSRILEDRVRRGPEAGRHRIRRPSDRRQSEVAV